MTDRYRHLLEGHERRSVQRADEYLGRNGNGEHVDGGVVSALREVLDRADPAELEANARRLIVLVALLILAVAVLASTALAGGKDCGKKWGAGAGLALLQQ